MSTLSIFWSCNDHCVLLVDFLGVKHQLGLQFFSFHHSVFLHFLSLLGSGVCVFTSLKKSCGSRRRPSSPRSGATRMDTSFSLSLRRSRVLTTFPLRVPAHALQAPAFDRDIFTETVQPAPAAV